MFVMSRAVRRLATFRAKAALNKGRWAKASEAERKARDARRRVVMRKANANLAVWRVQRDLGELVLSTD